MISWACSVSGEIVIFVMSMSVVSLLSSMFTVYMEGHTDVSRPPRWIRLFSFRVLAKAFFLQNEIPEVPEENDVEPVSPDMVGKVSEVKSALDGPMGEILARLEYFVRHLEDKKKSDAIVDEWKLVAKTIDRLLFWISLLITFSFFVAMAAST